MYSGDDNTSNKAQNIITLGHGLSLRINPHKPMAIDLLISIRLCELVIKEA